MIIVLGLIYIKDCADNDENEIRRGGGIRSREVVLWSTPEDQHDVVSSLYSSTWRNMIVSLFCSNYCTRKPQARRSISVGCRMVHLYGRFWNSMSGQLL